MAIKKAEDAVRTVKPSEKARLVKKAKAEATGVRPYDAEPVKGRPLEDFPDLMDVLPDLAERSRVLALEIAEREAERKEIGKTIESLLAAADAESIVGPTWNAIRTRGCNVSLSKERLVSFGVSLKIIEESTIRREYWYAQVRDRKVGDDE